MPEVSFRFIPPDPPEAVRAGVSSILSRALRRASGLDAPLELEVSTERSPSGCRVKVETRINELRLSRSGSGADSGAAAHAAGAALAEALARHRAYIRGCSGRTPVMELNILSKMYENPPAGPSVRRHFVKKLSPADAMAELDLSDAPGRIFFNTDTDRPCVILNHGEGRFEILEPGEGTTGGAGIETTFTGSGAGGEKAPDAARKPWIRAGPAGGTQGKLARFRPFLRCPACRGEVTDRDDGLFCAACRRAYEIRDGVPVMVLDESHDPEPRESPVSKNPYGQQTMQVIEKHGRGLVLDCGSGCPPARFDNVVHLEIVRYPGVDVVADGERLPFMDAAFDAVISEAVLEHVRDPFTYTAELRRVLKTGGEIRADAAFLQPYHAYPHHYFNMTLSGLELLMKDFKKIESGCGPHQQPFVTLGLVLQGMLDGIRDPGARARAGGMTLREVLQLIDERTEKEPFQDLTREAVRKLAAGFYFYGYKEK